MFQSAPAIAGGRCLAALQHEKKHRAFQSAPAIAGGRCTSIAGASHRLTPSCFNPRPPLLAGDAEPWHAVGANNVAVSIRARHCWRAMPASGSLAARRACFNPRPPLLAGDHAAPAPLSTGFNPRPPLLAGARQRQSAHRGRLVSIRARHCWRAMPARPLAGGSRPGQFQSAPAIAGGRCRVPRPPLAHAMRAFQSAPAIAGGRCVCEGRECRAGVKCFNPRPPLLAGDAGAIATACALMEFQSAPAIAGGRCLRARWAWRLSPHGVSIRARHCWRAMPHGVMQVMFLNSCSVFQSAPAIAGGRCHALKKAAKALQKFQSAPAIAGGRCGRRPGANPALWSVSIRARHCWRAMRSGPHLSWAMQVSIRARHCWRAMRLPCRGWRVGTLPTSAFQSAPAIAGGRCLGRAVRPGRWRRFQSAPAIAGGRCHMPRRHQVTGVDAVSIRARHCWRAMLAAMSVHRLAWHVCFNPRPPLLAGDACTKHGHHRQEARFQSAPAIAGGRCASLPTPCQSCTFSCSRANVCSTIPLVKQTYASKEEKHRTTTTYEACEPVRRNAITPGSRRAR